MGKISCFFGAHDFERSSFEGTGFAVIDWAFKPSREYTSISECQCGKVMHDGGYIVPSVLEDNSDADGWPLDIRGNRLPIKQY